MKKNIILDKKIAKYSILAGAALTMLTACGKDTEEYNDPNIAETDVSPDISLAASAGGLFSDIDLNNDGVVDVNVGIASYTYTAYGYTSNINYASMSGENGAEVLTQTEQLTSAGNTSDYQTVTPLNEGNTIGLSQVTWYDYGYMGAIGVVAGENVSIGAFLGADKFVGVKFLIGTDTHYGWIRMSLSADASSLSIKEYAYHITPNTPIPAGEK